MPEKWIMPRPMTPHPITTHPPLRESAVLDLLAQRLGGRGAHGVGDDLALVPMAGAVEGAGASGQRLLAGADAVIEGIHFLRGTDWRLVGRKALARNLSDVAAMGAEPVACLACAQFRPDMSLDDVGAILDGITALAQATACPLIGGDTSIHAAESTPMSLAVTVLARLAAGARPFTRCGAQPGDRVWVTGHLGGSLGNGYGRHLTFEPRLGVAMELRRRHDAGNISIHSMIDVSDGLGRDAARLAHASGVHLAIDPATLPITPGCDERQALSDGEDYELLFTAPASVEIEPSVAGVLVTPIGHAREVDDTHPAGAFVPDRRHLGRLIDISELGFDHGRPDAPGASST
ncbi:MAG: thiamine-phosphate kinase [Planctomycetota bacterium]|nr:thiamine-phosphate kinase [Planctomycetota bacterium]MDA1105095.1 thiamine-phosphate kinase [Planctomycetota bacterium]